MSTDLSPEQTTVNSPPADPIAASLPAVDRRRVGYCGITDEAAADLPGQLAAARELGWQAIELRSVDGRPLDLLSGPEFARTAARIAEAGLRVPVVASRIGGWARPVSCDLDRELNELALLADRCAALGTRYLRIMSYPNDGLPEGDWEREVLRRIRVLTRSAERHGVVLLHENCSGWAGRHADRALRLLDAAGSDAFGLLFDTGNGAAHGYRPLEMLRPLAPHVRHVQVKDAVRLPGDAVAYRTPGEGDAEVADCLRLLLAAGYQGHWSIEPHVAVRPHEGHRDDPAACRAAFARCGQALRELAETAATEATEAGGSWRGTAAGLEWTPPC